ncbi:hypothetical protein A5821_002785 [Enterococcus sp. 7F3_DIV0205]|uniref:Uncharacterized protein n=1 Tax=Candidatus Enterococcus palustris TaxID=1834189 RepID=A0AAQ3WAD7_9ENTE|nr:hypothetical protein A5821_003142 [Enterococcus sp. 7F3_DIV0205]
MIKLMGMWKEEVSAYGLIGQQCHPIGKSHVI